MPKNLVVISLDGISQTLFWQFRTAMPTLWQMSQFSVYFRRFYSTSTSAFQSFCDFALGSSVELDHNTRFPSEKGCLLGKATNLFSVLRQNGFAVLGAQHASFCPAYVKNDYFGAWDENCEFSWHADYDTFYNKTLGFIEQTAAAGKPFALYLSDRAGTVIDDCAEKKATRLMHERFTKGFSLVDGTVRKVLEKLASLSLLDDTVVCVFGPYGMDPWKHGIYSGRTNTMEPYADVCWTPMFLYNNNRDPKIVDSLACTIDLKATLLELFFPGIALEDGGTFAGVNLLKGIRDVVFMQNLFALERENEGPAIGLIKSYAATDGDQRLIVTSNGGIPGEGGMEYYYDPRDSTNGRNLLDFFDMKPDGSLTSFGLKEASHPHFLFAFRLDRPKQIIEPMVKSYNTMRKALQRLVATKEEVARQYCVNPAEAQFFDETRFTVKRRLK